MRPSKWVLGFSKPPLTTTPKQTTPNPNPTLNPANWQESRCGVAFCYVCARAHFAVCCVFVQGLAGSCCVYQDELLPLFAHGPV